MQSIQLYYCDCGCPGDRCNWGICRHNILSGTVITSETVMFVDTVLSKRQYSAKFAFCHVMTADDLVTCGPKGISGHNCIYLKKYMDFFLFLNPIFIYVLRLKLKKKMYMLIYIYMCL